ncbi:MAG: TlpA family protein disulfide reductase [Muribaculum sp.]|nr:TlpA family protein disulfide reductase [Muribaculum sp.]
MRRIIMCLMAAAIGLLTSATWGKKQLVWENPVARSVAASCSQVVEKVEFKPDETVVKLKVYSSTPFSYNKSTELYADGKTYAMKSYEGFEPGKYDRPENGVADIVMRFEPLPVNTTNFTLREPVNIKRGFFIENIHPITDNFMESSLWRNDATGEWLIGFFPEGAVYDGKFWQYGTTQLDKDTTKGKVTLINGDKTINVNIGKQKNLNRQIRIGNEKPIECSMITGPRLPDYPSKDLRPDLADNGYHPGDSVEISGWLRGPRKKSKPIMFQQYSIFGEGYKNNEVLQDTLGFFSIKLPVVNTQQIDIITDRDIIHLPFEPNQKYFFLIDYASGKKIVMGPDVRLQNELLANPLDRWMTYASDFKDIYNELLPAIKDFDRKNNSDMNEIIAANPNISERFKNFKKNNLKADGAFTLGQAYFNTDYSYPADMMQYAKTNYIDSLPSPLSAYRLYDTFINNIYDAANSTSDNKLNIIFKINDHTSYMSYILTDEGAQNAAPLIAKLKQLRKDNDYSSNLSDEEIELKNEILSIDSIPHAKISEEEWMNILFKRKLDILDSLKLNKEAKDIFLTQNFYNELENNIRPLAPNDVENAKKYISNEIGLKTILDLNDKITRLQQNDIPLRNERVELDSTLINGKELLDKILEPMRGKIVLLDVWGTWCGPCRAALKDFKEEEEHLRKYDLAYLFLASRSNESAWKTIIKEYGIDGDNIYHYNLPETQQSAIELYLGVTGFPSYFLVNRDGEVLDIKVDARNRNKLEEVIKKL